MPSELTDAEAVEQCPHMFPRGARCGLRLGHWGSHRKPDYIADIRRERDEYRSEAHQAYAAAEEARLRANQAEMDREDASEREATLREALTWLLNVVNGNGKAGGLPEHGEFEAAEAAARAALASPQEAR